MKLISILKEIQLTHRRSPKERQEKYNIILQKKIQQYIKAGGQGDLDLENTSATSLPQDLKVVGGSLNLSKSKITSLPQGLEVLESLYLDSSKITSLPQDLKVGRSINLYGTRITSLPQRLEVGEDLILNQTKIISLPRDLKVGGDFHCWSTPLGEEYSEEEIKKMAPGIKGKIIL